MSHRILESLRRMAARSSSNPWGGRESFSSSNGKKIPAAASVAVSVGVAIGVSLYFHPISLGTPSISTTECKEADQIQDKAQIVVLGSGSSTGCPKPLCAMMFANRGDTGDPTIEAWRKKCRVSNAAMAVGDPRHNRDYRNNPSLLLRQYDPDEVRTKNILIDAGKTFREGALRWFPERDVRTLDAIVLTHHHMDAVGGLDDVRGFQRFVMDEKRSLPIRVPIPVHLSALCHHHLSNQFPWLIKSDGASHSQSKDGGATGVTVKRDVANLDSRIFDDYVPFSTHGMKITPLPVWHGDDLICHGFAFSMKNKNGTFMNVVYLSDISRMIPETLEHIQNQLPQPTDLLILDCLLWNGTHPVHFGLDQAVELSQTIRPSRQTLLVGMSCDAFLPHDEMNALLSEKYGKSELHPDLPAIQLAYDGMVVDV